MISFFNEFISYLLLVIIMAAVAVCGAVCGKKLRDRKDTANNAAGAEDAKDGNKQ
ncbi:MAG: vanadium nitrogenase [Lachnospiraceae bacterium]|nr:vanadium nitrogenase [Lachnospiraceae bacterium]